MHGKKKIHTNNQFYTLDDVTVAHVRSSLVNFCVAARELPLTTDIYAMDTYLVLHVYVCLY